jgi:hypothetical protein
MTTTLKINCNISSVAALFVALVTAISTNAQVTQVTLPVLAEEVVRDGASQNVFINPTTVGPGFERIKYVQDASGPGAPNGNTTGCAKSYFKWDFTGQNPNTNADLTISWAFAVNSQITAFGIWSLDQAYPAFTNSVQGQADTVTNMSWNNAQANDTNFNLGTVSDPYQGTFQMLTNGPFTAHPVINISQPASAATSYTIRAPWGNLIHNNQIVFAICGTNNAAVNGNNGYRILTNSAALGFNSLSSVGAHPPSISLIPAITVTENQTATNSFTLTDPDGNPANFNNGGSATVTATTSDQTGQVIASVTVVGSGASENIQVTAGSVASNATVEVTATDENGDEAQETVNVTVVPPIFPPTISTPANTNTLFNTSVVVPFTIGDRSEAVSTLQVSATVDANSMNELASTTVGGSGSNLTVTVTPNANADGVGLVDLSVSDTNGNTTTTSFAVMVLTNYAVFIDHFDYSAGSIFTGSDGLWARRGNVQFNGLNVAGDALNINSGAVNDNGYAPLVSAPFNTGHGKVIYYSFTGNFTIPPPANSGTFISLSGDSVNSAPQLCNIGSAADGNSDGGNLYLTIANGSGVAVTNFYPIVLGTTYFIAARYDVDNGTSTLWVNSTNEADAAGTNVMATDITAPIAVSLVDVNQNGNSTDLSLDDLKVSVVTKPVATSVQVAGGYVQINFAASAADSISSFGILGAPNLNSPFTPVNATISSLGGGAFSATLQASGNQGFYRLFRQPFNF